MPLDQPGRAAWHFTLSDREQREVELGDALQIHLIELRKAERLGQLAPGLSAWIACLLHNLDEAAMNQITHPPVRDALKHLDELYSDDELRLVIQRRQQALMDERDALAFAAQEGERKGLQEGIQKGLREGLQKGAAALLERLLARKFGPLPEAIRQRVQRAEAGQLQAWSLNVLEAESLANVFDGSA